MENKKKKEPRAKVLLLEYNIDLSICLGGIYGTEKNV